MFPVYSLGVSTNRDPWVYGFSRERLSQNVRRMLRVYNEQVAAFMKVASSKPKKERAALVDGFVEMDPKKISWSAGLKADLVRGSQIPAKLDAIRTGVYRPFCKQNVHFDESLIERPGLMRKIFPTPHHKNVVICTTGVGNRIGFSSLVVDAVPDLHAIDASGGSQCFPLYVYEKNAEMGETGELVGILKGDDLEVVDGFRRSFACGDSSTAEFRRSFGANVTKADIFYYVYGVLHSPEYRTRFSADLRKMLPRIPMTREVTDFWRFTEAGRQLAHWHINYETVEPYPVKEHRSILQLDPAKDYLVQKMTFARKDKQVDKSTIVYNANLTLLGIPLEAFDYVLNGKSAIEWVMERYQVTVDKDSGIRNDPNDWAREHGEPRYILDLLKRVVRVSLETMKIVRSLPAINERTSSQPVVAS